MDLDYEVELILFSNQNYIKDVYIENKVIRVTNVSLEDNEPFKWKFCSIFAKSIRQNILDIIFPIRPLVEKTLKFKLNTFPDAIHHFEYLNTASASVSNIGNFIWSNHDHVSNRFLVINRHKKQQGIRRGFLKLWFRYFCLRLAEKLVATSCKFVLTISATETEDYRAQIPTGNFELLPCSRSEEFSLITEKQWLKKNKLKMLHLGSLNSAVPYSSLLFILNEVFPLIAPSKLKQIEFYIVGPNDDGVYSKKIKTLSSNYENVHITGFVENLKHHFDNSDIQLVGLQFPTGIRTRIIESFARGLPVLSTIEGADGLYGLKNNENILIANNALDFANKILGLIINKEKLIYLSNKGYELYNKHYSREIQSKRLNNLLAKYF